MPNAEHASEKSTGFNLLDVITNSITGFIIGTISIPIGLFFGLEALDNLSEDTDSIINNPIIRYLGFICLLIAYPFLYTYDCATALEDYQNDPRAFLLNRIPRRRHEDPMPKIHFSVTGYARVAFNFIAGFVWGWVKAPLVALQNLFIKKTTETPLMQLLKSPLCFIADLITTPFNTGLDWVHDEALILKNEKAESDVKMANHKNNNESLKPLGYVKAFFGFLVGLILSPIHGVSAILNPPGKGLFHSQGSYNAKFRESLLQWLIKAPFRFIRGALECPFLMAKELLGDGIKVNLAPEAGVADNREAGTGIHYWPDQQQQPWHEYDSDATKLGKNHHSSFFNPNSSYSSLYNPDNSEPSSEANHSFQYQPPFDC